MRSGDVKMVEALKEILEDKEAEERMANNYYVACGNGVTYLSLIISIFGAISLYVISLYTVNEPVYVLISPECIRFMWYTIWGNLATMGAYSTFWAIAKPKELRESIRKYRNRTFRTWKWEEAKFRPLQKDQNAGRVIGLTFFGLFAVDFAQWAAAGIGVGIPQVSVMQVTFFYLFAGNAETMLYSIAVSAWVQLTVFGILRIFSDNNKACAWVGGIIAVIVSAWVHGSAHGNYADNFPVLLGTYLSGGIFSAMYLLTGNTLISQLIHIGVNATTIPDKLATIVTKGFW